MFFLDMIFLFFKTIFSTKMSLALIQIYLSILDNLEKIKNVFFDKFTFVFTFFYDLKKFQFDQVEVDSILESLSFFLLLVTVILYWFETAFQSKAKKQGFGSIMVKLSNLSLTFLLVTRWAMSHHFPLSNLYESLVFLSWSLTLIHLVLEKKSNTLLIGVLLSPITLFINGFALFTLPVEMQKGNFLTPALQSNWLMMHVTVMISSYAALLSGSILAIAFLVITKDSNKNQEMEDKIHGGSKSSNLILQSKIDLVSVHFAEQNVQALQSESKEFTLNSGNLFVDKIKKDNFNNLSLIEQNKGNLAKTLDNLSYRTIGIGFPLLTIGILSGAVWANEAWGSYWSWDPKETWALITWFLFAIYLHARITKGLQGKKPAIIATVGFVVVWICFLGVNLASQGLHTYGWLQ